MVDEITPDRVVAIRIDGNLNLGSHAVRARHQNGFAEPGWNAEHAAESAESAHDAGGEGGFYELPDAILGSVGSIDVYPGASVAKRVVAHAGNASSNATRRRMSRIRWSISARVTVINRSIENFSTAKEPITEPKITARRMF